MQRQDNNEVKSVAGSSRRWRFRVGRGGDGDSAMVIQRMLGKGVFSPEQIEIIGWAFELACHDLRADSQSDATREAIAKRMIQLARQKEWTAAALADQTLLSLGIV